MPHDPTMIRPKRVVVAVLAVAVVAGTSAVPTLGAKMRHEGGAMHPVQVK